MFDKKNIWDSTVTKLTSNISDPQYRPWFSNTVLKSLDHNLAVIEVPNKFIASWLTDNYLKQIQGYLKEVLNSIPKIRFTYRKTTTPQITTQNARSRQPGHRLIGGLNPTFTFGNFITANTNVFAYSSALEVTDKPGSQYNPLYIYSEFSLGKTHLLNAIGNEIIINNPGIELRFFSVDQFSSDFSFALKTQNISKFREAYNNTDFLIIDDIHRIGGREKSQRELVRLFNFFYESNKQMVFAGKTLPCEIQNLLPPLRSRFEWGLLSEIQPPDHKTKMEIIKEKVKVEKLEIPDDLVFFLTNNISDFKTLNQYIVNLKSYIDLHNGKIDIATVKLMIEKKPYYTVTLRDIQGITAEYFNISLAELLSNKRTQKFSYPRHIAMYLSRMLTDLSFKEIAKAFSNKNHSTVVYAVKCIKKNKAGEKRVLDDINGLYKLLS